MGNSIPIFYQVNSLEISAEKQKKKCFGGMMKCNNLHKQFFIRNLGLMLLNRLKHRWNDIFLHS